jgi:hypothetical protein
MAARRLSVAYWSTTGVGVARGAGAAAAVGWEGSTGRHRRRVAYSCSGSTGLPTKSVIPAAVQARRSSSKTLAVIATIGIEAPPGSARIARVASRPSMSGICTSIRIRS